MVTRGTQTGQRRRAKALEQEAFLAVVRTAAMLTDAIEQVLRPDGLTMAQYNVLRILRGAGPGGLCRNEVRDRMLTRMPDMTRLLDRMEDAGLIVRARGTEDRRLVTTRITPVGAELLDRLEEPVAAEHRLRFETLTAPETRTLVTLLDRLRAAPADS